MRRFLLLALCALLPQSALADEGAGAAGPSHLSRFGHGDGPTHADGLYRMLDAAQSKEQSNAVAFDRALTGPRKAVDLRCKLRVLEGGDGGAFVFLNTSEYGAHGPAPFVKHWVEPNLSGTFAVGVDVHNPPSKEMFTPWGNYQDLPQREISLHFDGREIVKRVAPREFRGDFADVHIHVQHVCGGAEVTVEVAGVKTYDRYFVAGLHPYELRLAIGAGTRADAVTQFDVKDLDFSAGAPAGPRRAPLHFEVFNHVLTDNKKTAFEKTVDLPPVNWAFGRVMLTLEIHDAGPFWDEWDRNGEVSIWDAEGKKLGIVPFITSYRTACHWQVDVTHFRPFLAGKTRFEIRAGTNFYKGRGYMMSVSLDFHPGTPELEPYRVVPLWIGTARYRSAENHFKDFFEPREVAIDEEAIAAHAYITTTGHSQIGEFTPSRRTLLYTPQTSEDSTVAARFANRLWKTDCYLNPNRPQFGTWQFARAGWAPGDVVRPWIVDLTPHLETGVKARIDYEPEPYEFEGAEQTPSDKQINAASHVVRAYLVLYRKPGSLAAAPSLRVTNVADGSNAAKAGMKSGDYLARYDGKSVDSIDELRAALGGAAAAGKETVVVVLFRGSKRMEVELPVGKMGIGLAAR